MDDIALAMLGDKEAAERLTETGVLIPCQHCGGQMIISFDSDGVEDTLGRKWAWTAVCGKCCATTGLCYSKEQSIKANNTRAAVLTPEQMEKLK